MDSAQMVLGLSFVFGMVTLANAIRYATQRPIFDKDFKMTQVVEHRYPDHIKPKVGSK